MLIRVIFVTGHMDSTDDKTITNDEDDEYEEEITNTVTGKVDKKVKRFSVLGVRMKEYEAVLSSRVDTAFPYIVRLDGHKFSSFTRPFKKPFDVRIHNAMRQTLIELLDQFRPCTGFTCSDEITLVFPVLPNEKTGELRSHADFDAKVQKITTLSAGFASVCFYKALKNEKFEAEEQSLVEHIERTKPHFDARVFNVPSNVELVNNLLWRASWDFRRNSISTLAQAHFSSKQLHGKNTKVQMEMLNDKGIHWESQPDWYKWGVFAKKEKYLKESDVKGEKVTSVRTRITVKSFEMARKYEKKQEDWIVSKYWPLSQEVINFEVEQEKKGKKGTEDVEQQVNT